MSNICVRLQTLQSVLKASVWPNLSSVQPMQPFRRYNANRSAICKISRTKYCRLYRVLLVYPDGSTITVRHPEPQSIVQLPRLLEDCKTETERRDWLMRRKRVEKIQTEDDMDCNYNQKQYLHLFRHKSRS